MAQEEAKRAEEAERKKAALAALNVKQGPKTGTISPPLFWSTPYIGGTDVFIIYILRTQEASWYRT